ncbi:hypothetical protein GCM10027456_06100 [Kineosporia babensis]
MLSARSAYAALAALNPRLPSDDARLQLLHRLAEITRAEAVRFYAGSGASGPLRAQLAWPPGEFDANERLELADLRQRADIRAWAVLRHEEQVHGVLTVSTRRRLSRGRRRELNDTANCLMVLLRRDQVQDELERQQSYTMQLAGEVLDSTRQLAGVRELERRRVAAEVVTFSRTRLSPLQTGIDRLVESTGQSRRIAELDRLRSQLDELVTDFRALVRGIYPQVLSQRGLRAALAEVAAGHPGQFRITGSVPGRVDPEVAASLYYLSTVAMQALAPDRADLEIVLEHRRLETLAAGLQVTLQARTSLSKAQIRAALTVESDRLGTIGGWVDVHAEADRIRVVAWVPDRLEPVSRAGLVAVPGLHARVRAQALGLVARYAEAPGSARARRLLSRLDEPVHVAVLTAPESGRRLDRVTETVRTRPNLVLVPFVPGSPGGRPDRSTVAHGDLSLGIADAVPDVLVRPGAADPAQRFELVLPGVGRLGPDRPWSELPEVLTTEVVARADLLRSRTALATMLDLVRLNPPPAPRRGALERDLDELRSGAGELDALENEVQAQL